MLLHILGVYQDVVLSIAFTFWAAQEVGGAIKWFKSKKRKKR